MAGIADYNDQGLTDDLIRVLGVERVEDDFYRGVPTPDGRGRSFGGLVIAQGLMAATETVDASRPAHSLHAYFMRPGDATKPVLYRVERDRDGGSFATRRVIAIQHGQPILNLAASFHRRETGLSHQDRMPDVPAPEDLETEQQIAARMEGKLSQAFLEFLKRPRAIEFRPVGKRAPFTRETLPPANAFWFRAKGEVVGEPALHRVILAYASDFGLLGASMLPHAKTFTDPEMQTASLDHALWMHADFRVDDWLLYTIDSPWAGAARGFNRGAVYSRDGRLVASVAQEGLIRELPAKN